MIKIQTTDDYAKWYKRLNDTRAKAKIIVRVRRMSLGNFGDVKPIGSGVSELRISYGPGYRVYFTKQDDTIVILLCGGDKSTQTKDITKAKTLAKELKQCP